MILYNVTIILDEVIHDDWLVWMRRTHIAQVMDTGCFASCRILKVLDSPNEGITYCIQYVADSMEKYMEYEQNYSARLQADIPDQFLNKFVSFSTIMEFISNDELY